MTMPRQVVQHGLTEAQLQLLKRHERALLRLADELARRGGLEPTSVMFVLADPRGRMGGALGAALPLATIGPVILPGRAELLAAWVEQLATYAPVWDLQGNVDGLTTIVIDESDAIAIVRVALRH